MLTNLGMDVRQKVTRHVEAQNEKIVRTIGEEKATMLREMLETLA